MSPAAPATSHCASSSAPAAAARRIVCDMTEAMLRTGRDRAIDRGRIEGIEWLAGDAERLPLASMTADCCTIAFGLRNVTTIGRALAETRRVLRPGGRFLCLEFSRVVLPLLARAYDLYSFAVSAAPGPDRDGRPRRLSIPGRKHPSLSRPGRPRPPHARGRASSRSAIATSPAASPRFIPAGACERRRSLPLSAGASGMPER